MIYVESSQIVSPEQKMEIIRKTDTFYLDLYYGNNHKFNRELYMLSGVPANFDKLDLDHSCNDMDYIYMPGDSILKKINTYEDWLHNFWGGLKIRHMKNQWISSSHLTGWINPKTGKIGGIAAGPSEFEVTEIANDLRTIAREWPNLDFTATLYDNQQYYIYEKWRVYGGDVYIIPHPEILEIEPTECISLVEISERIEESTDIRYWECWWTLDELKKAWFKKLFCDPSKYYIKRDGRFLCVFIPDGGVDNLGDVTGNIYNLRRRASLKRIKLSWKNLMRYRVNVGTSYSMKPDNEGYEGPYKIFWK